MSFDDRYGVDSLDAAEIQQLASLARSVTPEDSVREPVPDDLWRSIEAELDTVTSRRDQVVSLQRHRRAWRPLAAVAAAALLVAGIVGVTSLGGSDDGEVVVATADLAALADGFDGDVSVIETDEGLELTLDLGELPAEDGFYELWLIKDLETGQMQSLGPIAGSGTIQWPAGFDPAEYAVVDISIEPRDGVPTHSGVSVLRGTLES